MKLFEFLRKSSVLVMGLFTAKIFGFEDPKQAQESDLSAEDWQVRFDEAEKNLSTLNTQFEAAIAERDTATSKLSASETKLTQTEQKVTALESRVAELEKEKGTLETKNAELNKALDEAPEIILPGSTAEDDPKGPDEKAKGEMQAKIDSMPHNQKADKFLSVFKANKE